MTTRMIERWFPCAEVSKQSASGWGKGTSERSLFVWFAPRPLAQAKAAVLCSLLPWPDSHDEQERLKSLVRASMEGYDTANSELRAELAKHYPNGAKICDPFSGRGIIPLEAARLGVQAWGIDYSPVATIAGLLLADYPMRNWDDEPALPFDGYKEHSSKHFTEERLLRDVRFVLDLVGDRYEEAMDQFYPKVNGKRPWGYVWAVTLPCVNCGNRYPLTGRLALRTPGTRKRAHDPGQSYRIKADTVSGTFHAEIHDGPPTAQPTLAKVKGRQGKTGFCCFCQQAHPPDTLKRLMRDGLAHDALLVVADHDSNTLRRYREATSDDLGGVERASETLPSEPPFGPGLPAVPTERLAAGLSAFIGPAGYGYRTWGQLCNSRQTVGFVRLCRIIDNMFDELRAGGVTFDYAAALTAYAASNLARRLKYSTRSTTLQPYPQKVSHIYFNDSGISHSFDYFETGCGEGPGTWPSLSEHTVRAVRKQVGRAPGLPAAIHRGSATELPFPDGLMDAVVTDPPYAKMINYCDSTDLLYVWMKRALGRSHPWLAVTTDPDGLQDKTLEAVIARGSLPNEHRSKDHYQRCIAEAFDEARLKTQRDGIVSVVFGHGDPDAWIQVLTSITDAGLVLTGSWPCNTEKGGKQTGENITNTIMMSCRPASTDRRPGDIRVVEGEIRAEIASRVREWNRDGLAASDQRMAAIGPAMEIVGRYGEVRDFTGAPVGIDRILALAYKAVEDAADIRIDRFRLADFDDRSRFALSWARQHRRIVAAASEARWQRLSYDLSERDVDGILVKRKGGVRLATGKEAAAKLALHPNSPVIDIALNIAAQGRSVSDIADVLHQLERETDEMLWAAVAELARYVGKADRDGSTWTWAYQHRGHIDIQAAAARSETEQRERLAAATSGQETLF